MWWLLPLASLAAPLAASTIDAASGAATGAAPMVGEVASAGASTRLLEVSINGVPQPGVVTVQRRADGGLLIPVATVQGWRLKTDTLAVVMHAGEPHVGLDALTGVAARLDEATQRLELSIDPARFVRFETGFGETARIAPSPAARAAFVNYLVSADVGATRRQGALLEAGGYVHDGLLLTDGVASRTPGSVRAARLDTSWTRDWPDALVALRLGDTISRGGIGTAPLRYGGLQFGRSFELEPGFSPLPLPTLDGSAALPSTIELVARGTTLRTVEIPAGDYRLSDLPAVTGAGQFTIVTRDVLGRRVETVVDYYTTPGTLRAGLHDYAVEVGALRRGFGRASFSYGRPFAGTTQRYGFSNHLTGELRAEGTDAVQLLGAGAILSLPRLGAVSLAAAGSRSKGDAGGLLSLGVERRDARLSVGVRSELATARFHNPALPRDGAYPASSVQAFASTALGRLSVGGAYLRRDHRRAPDEEILSFNLQLNLRRSSLGFNLQQINQPERTTVGALVVTIPFGVAGSYAAGARLDRGRVGLTAGAQKSPPTGVGTGWAIQASSGRGGELDARYQVNTPHAIYAASLATFDGDAVVRAEISGSLIDDGAELVAARPVTSSYGLVRVDGIAGIRVLADEQLVGTTDRRGRLVIPNLRALEANRVRIEAADLPIDATVGAAEVVVRPLRRAGADIAFDAAATRAVTLTVRHRGAAPAAGTVARLEGSPMLFTVGSGGRLYLSGLAARNRVIINDTTACAFELDVPDNDDPLPDLGVIECE